MSRHASCECASWKPAQTPRQRVEVNRFHQVFVKTGLQRPAKILALAVAGQCNQFDVIEPFQRADAPRNFVAVHLRKSDVQEYDVRRECNSLIQYVPRRVDRPGYVAVELKHAALTSHVTLQPSCHGLIAN